MYYSIIIMNKEVTVLWLWPYNQGEENSQYETDQKSFDANRPGQVSLRRPLYNSLQNNRVYAD